MKKLVSLCLAIVCLLACMPVHAAEMDLSFVRENENIFTIDVDVENDVAFVESKLSVADRAFVHQYDSSTRYSSTQFDVLVLDYLKSSAYPIYRLWITYCADDAYLNITSVSFIIGDQKYTFSDIADADWYTHDDKGYREQVLIKFDEDTLKFLAALEDLTPTSFDDFEGYKLKMILHGREDVEVELGRGFGLDFFCTSKALINIGGLDFLEKCNGSTLKVTDAH